MDSYQKQTIFTVTIIEERDSLHKVNLPKVNSYLKKSGWFLGTWPFLLAYFTRLLLYTVVLKAIVIRDYKNYEFTPLSVHDNITKTFSSSFSSVSKL